MVLKVVRPFLNLVDGMICVYVLYKAPESEGMINAQGGRPLIVENQYRIGCNRLT